LLKNRCETTNETEAEEEAEKEGSELTPSLKGLVWPMLTNYPEMKAVVHVGVELSRKRARFGWCLLIGLAGSALQAQELAPYLEAADHGPLLASVSLPSDVGRDPLSACDEAPQRSTSPAPLQAPVSLWSAPPDLIITDSPLNLTYDRVQAILHSSDIKSMDDDDLVLVRTRVPSRFAYQSWAKLETGYGQYLGPDTVGRWRTNGVGIEDPDYLYLKLNLRF
jgi:hypothetical protein